MQTRIDIWAHRYTDILFTADEITTEMSIKYLKEQLNRVPNVGLDIGVVGDRPAHVVINGDTVRSA